MTAGFRRKRALQDLALGERRRRLRPPSGSPRASKRAHSAKARQKRKSPATSVSPSPYTASADGLPAAHLAAVDDVVVEQRRRVDQLERDGRVDHVVAAGRRPAGGGMGDEQHDRRPDALAAGADQVARDLGQARLARRRAPRASRSSTRARSSSTPCGTWSAGADGACATGVTEPSRLNENGAHKVKDSPADWPGRRRFAFAEDHG